MRNVTMLAAAAILGAATAAGADSLPIERGYYVRTDTPCRRASNATITLYNGISFGYAHVESRQSEDWPMVRTKSPNSAGMGRDAVGRGQPSPQGMLF
jgi:hypothetical protein